MDSALHPSPDHGGRDQPEQGDTQIFIHDQEDALQEAPSVDHQRPPDQKAGGHEPEGDRTRENTGAVKPPGSDAHAENDEQKSNCLKHQQLSSVFTTLVCACLSLIAGVWGLSLFASIYATVIGVLIVTARSGRKGDPALIADLTYSRLALAVVASSLYYVGPGHGGMAYLPMLAFSGLASAFADYSARYREAVR